MFDSDYFVGLLFVVFIGGCAIYFLGWLAEEIVSWFSAPPAPPPSPEDFDQEAALYRARSRAFDAQAAHDDSRARAALKKEELQEVEDFIKAQRTKRGNGRR